MRNVAAATFLCLPLFLVAPFSHYVIFIIASVYSVAVASGLIFGRVNPEEAAEVDLDEPLRGSTWEEIFRNAVRGYAASQRIMEDQVLDAAMHIIKSRYNLEGQALSKALGDREILRDVFPDELAEVILKFYARRRNLKESVPPDRWWKEMEVVIKYAGGVE